MTDGCPSEHGWVGMQRPSFGNADGYHEWFHAQVLTTGWHTRTPAEKVGCEVSVGLGRCLAHGLLPEATSAASHISQSVEIKRSTAMRLDVASKTTTESTTGSRKGRLRRLGGN